MTTKSLRNKTCKALSYFLSFAFVLLFSCSVKAVVIITPPPVVAFTGVPTSVCTGDSVHFANSTSNATTYAWTFQGGTPATSTATNPTIAYNTPGTYSVSLTATGPGGTATGSQTNYITVANCAPGTQTQSFSYTGTIQHWTVPPCVTTLSVTAAGASGGCNIALLGGLGAVVTATVTVVPGDQLNIAVGGAVSAYTNVSTTCSGDGGGGGTFIWDGASTTLPLVVAGGGGGAGGQNQPGSPGSTTIAPNNTANTGAAGTGGNASGLATGTAYGGSGAGWLTAVGIPATSTLHLGGGGVGLLGAPPFDSGSGSQGCIGAPHGGWGGGGGGGQEGTSTDYGGGGGGGGYNGGGGGNGVLGSSTLCYSGGGGGSGFYNAGFPYTTIADFVSPTSVTQTNGGNGYVLFTWVAGAPTVTATNTNTSCNGGNDGTATATPGGAGPFTYSWNTAPVQTNATATGLSAGTYIVTVANGCSTATASVNITQPTAVTATITTIVPAACGASNGSATVSPGGGTGAYTYSWNDPLTQTNATATGLSAGNYTVTVTDANNCSATASCTIISTAGLAVSCTVNANTGSCDSIGSATANPSGGVTPYTYLWNDPNAQTLVTATGLSAGSYNVNVQDANGCTGTASVSITAAPAITDVAVVNNNSSACGNTGSATATPGGGVPPYTYLWTGGNTNANATGLSAGSYTVTVTDAVGCDNTSATVSITAAPAFSMTAVVNNNSSACGNTGSATSNPVGGTTPYTYLWTGGNTNANATGLSAGAYIVTAKDANGCQQTASVNITAPAALSQTNSFVAATCGLSNGSASIVVSGGNTPYTYSWNSVPVQTTPTAAGLSGGTYIVHVNDVDNCTITASVTVPSASAEVITFPTIVNVLCKGSSTGSITASVTSGVAPYTYNWTPTGGTTATAANLSAGTYVLSVQDANGCLVTASALITEPATAVSVTTGGIVNLTCSSDSDGSATANPAGGTPPYVYSWAPTGGNAATASNLKSGVFVVTITDAAGCQASANATIGSGNPTPVVSFTADSVKGCIPVCTLFNDASTVAGGSIQSEAWNFGNGNTGTGATPGNCYNTPGTFSVSLTVTSNLGCVATLSTHNMINAYSYPIPSFTFTPQPTTIMSPQITFTDISTDAYGSIQQWHWTFGDLTDSSSINKTTVHTYQDTGSYCATLKVTNIHQCTDSVTECLVISPEFTMYIPTAFTPNGDGLNDVFNPVCSAVNSFTMYIFDRWGNLVFTTADIKQGWNGRIRGTPGPEDVYIYNIQVTDNLNNPHSYTGRVMLLQ